MTEKRVNFKNIVSNQLPDYVKQEFPLISEFLSQYYISQEFESAPVDLIQNIDRYIKVDTISSRYEELTLLGNIDDVNETITIDLSVNPEGTLGFPDSYGLIQIDNEIITYLSKTKNSFLGCKRGFSGISSYINENKPDQLVFSQTNSESHKTGSKITNLTTLFLKEFLKKIKYQLTPGFEDREFFGELNQRVFLKQAKDFYNSKGTDQSFNILFKSLYGKEVKIIDPKDYLFRPSDSQFISENVMIVESIEGDPFTLENCTLYQDQYGNIGKANGPITRIEKIYSNNTNSVGVGNSYYKLSLDSGYDRDITVNGSIFGRFSTHPQTISIEELSENSSTISVDSTVGFPNSGELYVNYFDNTVGIVSYTSKSLNQFFGCTNITKRLKDSSFVGLNTFAYSYNKNGDLVKLRINSIIKDLKILGPTKYQYKNDRIKIKTLGSTPDDVKSNVWILNLPTKYNVSKVDLVDSSDNSYNLTLEQDHIFIPGDTAIITDNTGSKTRCLVVDILSRKSISIKGQGLLNNLNKYTIKRNLSKVRTSNFSSLSSLNSNVQNVYTDREKTLVSSPSVPSYKDQTLNVSDTSIVFSGSFIGDEFTITSLIDHNFYTGDSVYYTPEYGVVTSFEDGIPAETTQVISSLFAEGIYFVKRINSTTIKLAKSRSDIYNNRFVSLDNRVTVNNNKFQLYSYKNNSLESQKILREISTPVNDGKIYNTNHGGIGILINGVEILNYKSTESVYYGQLNGIDVSSPGSGYDIINPPLLKITDSVGFGATGHFSISGSLSEIRIIDPGFDYVETPIIEITGGNGIGAKAYPNMKVIEHFSEFNSENKSLIGIGSTLSTIGFSTYHKFRNGERVVYKTNGQKSISGLVTNSTYYVSVLDSQKIRLHNSLNDSISGINTIVIGNYGIGKHSFKSFDTKKIIGSITVENPGTGYANNRKICSSLGINTSFSQINIKDHGFNSGEVVKYANNAIPVSGLSTNKEYYVIKLDKNNFRLSEVGIGSTEKDYYYKSNKYVSLYSVGSGSHIFNYPEIKVHVIGNVGISSAVDTDFKAIVQPIFRGQITSVQLTENGVGYGSSEIIGFSRSPICEASSGRSAQLNPIISSEGKIVEVLVNNSGQDYNSPPDLVINGAGFGAVLTPIISDGKLVQVKVIESGIGYVRGSTSIDVVPAGTSVKFNPKIQSWTINLFRKYFGRIVGDDGFLYPANEDYGLQYFHLYPPRKLREYIQPKDNLGNPVYGNNDLQKINNIESFSQNHSPIIGWAYDGNPIYGPYGYLDREGGVVSQLKSGYVLESKSNRPPTSAFPNGFFVEDFTYKKVSDPLVLDEHNGRFCVTPEFPSGTYAYFSTLNDLNVDSSGPFVNYKRPVFPYFIGNTYRSKPNTFNTLNSSNQDSINLNETNWIRNTKNYNLFDNGGKVKNYDYLKVPNNLNQISKIHSVLPGNVDFVGIVSGGTNYNVGDYLEFNEEKTRGYGVSAVVSSVFGKPVNTISVASSTVSNVEIYPSNIKGQYILFSSHPHNFKNKDTVIISGLNTTSTLIEGPNEIGITTNFLKISGIGSTSGSVTTGIGSVGVTGIVTYINVVGNLNYPQIRENDILSIENEKVRVLNVDNLNYRIRVLREYNGTIGSAHTASTLITENPRKLFVDSGFKTSYSYRINKEIYFNPVDSIGIGTISGVGIGYTISFSNPGAGSTQLFVPTKSIYLQNHGLETGDELIYSYNGGSSIVVSQTGIGTTTLNDQSVLYVAKISEDLIGISTVKVGLGSTGSFVGIASTNRNKSTLYFVGVGTGVYHSFKTNYSENIVTGTIEKNTVTVSTSQTHGLLNNDIVDIWVNPSISTSFTVKYDDFNRKLLINPKNFSSLDVNTTDNTISINNHSLENGQKIIHTSSSPSGGLENNKIYYVVYVDKNKIKLSGTYFDSIQRKPIVVNITSSSSGTISPINPKLHAFKDSAVTFDLSDSSLSYVNKTQRYPAFSFDLYLDSNFTLPFYTTKTNRSFELKTFGVVGISTDARVVLTVNDNLPNNLYYKLTPLFDNNIPLEKQQVNVDKDVLCFSQINIVSSLYNGKYPIVSTSSTTFSYSIGKYPESQSYSSQSSELKYSTSSTSALGSIKSIKLNNKGLNYYSLPSVSNVVSKSGFGALLECGSSNIGRINKVSIDDVGYGFPSDKTVSPTVSIPQIIKIDLLSSFEEIGITSVGRGYSVAPKLLVFDGSTKKIVPEIDIRYTLGDNKVTIFKNAFGLSNVPPTILPINNTNGVGVSTVSYNKNTKEVTLGLSVGFSTADSFPFSANDKVLVENISVGVGSTGIGYNSENYGYKLFTVKSVTENRGGIGSISYSLEGLLGDNQIPGNYDPVNSSSARVIPEKFFPIFNPILKKNNYFINEEIKSQSAEGIVLGWDSNTNYLRALSTEDFNNNEIVEGKSSKTKGIISKIEYSPSIYNLDSISIFKNGWELESGFLNNNQQRIQDSDYYQNFSYSIKSEVPFQDWNDLVSTLNHTAGFKKFSDYQLESKLPEYLADSLTVGITTNTSSVDITVDVIGYGNLNCFYDFDLVRENRLNAGGSTFSNEITFSNRVLTDYFESVGNRVLLIDDISQFFNSNPRPTKYSEVNRFQINSARAQKYITFIRDRRYGQERQASLVSLVHDNSLAYITEYGRVETDYDQGSFDFVIEGSEGVLLFYPTKYEINDFNVTSMSFNIKEGLVGIASTTLGGVVNVKGSSNVVSVGTTTNIVSTSSTFNSVKVLVEIESPDNEYEFVELNVVHDGTNAEFVEYGKIFTEFNGYPGLGTYHPYVSGSNLKVDFIPSSSVGVALTITTFEISLGKTVGIGSFEMKYSRVVGSSTTIASSPTPIANVVAQYEDVYECGYFIAQVADTTNNRFQISELITTDNADPGSGFTSSFYTEFANVETFSGLGTFGTIRSGTNTQLVFTPKPNINTTVTLYYNVLRYEDDSKISNEVSLQNGSIRTGYGEYFGTERDIKRSFDLTYKANPIFKRDFTGNSSGIVDVSNNTITMANHFFVSGEEVTYTYAGAGTTQAIGIGTTYISVGVGTTDKLPRSVYVVKLNESSIKLAKSAEDALKTVPVTLDITHVGIGTSHTFTAKNQNAKVMVAIDNLIQSPIVSTALTTTLATNLFTTSDLVYLSGITSFFGGDLIKIENEIMRIESVGIGSTNVIRVRRPWLGTVVSGYSTGTVVTKVEGTYNIVDNTINFVEAPYGNVPFSSSTNPPDSRDWVGISTSSKFQGRVFLRSGTPNTTSETYYKNYIFNDISSQFNGTKDTFTLKSNGSNISGIENENAIVLLNDIFQGPGLTNDYILSETAGITSITFVGTATSVAYDVNTSQLPVGGIIVSVGSSQGFGYQPLVSAGGTAIISGLGTISSISIGNSGSGYRSGAQTVRVGVATTSLDTISIKFIGTATVSNGHVVSVAITNPGSGYTSTNPPYVIIDDPLSYTNIPLIYSSSSSSGIGSNATVDIVVGQGSSVVNFELRNTGFGYGEGQILTVGIGGTVGIPTDTTKTYKEFQIFVDEIYNDKFSSWSVGELQPIDDVSDLFDGSRLDFPLRTSGNIISIRAAKGSPINIRDTLLVFVNDTLQVPGYGYQFEGGSVISFSESPKEGDNCKILFYRGSGSIDVVDRNILETVKAGDELTIGYDPSVGQLPILQEEPRTVEEIVSTEVVNTLPYFGPGITEFSNLKRPVVWCKQTEDKIINEKEIGKDRILYEASIYPTSYLIQSVGIGSTIVFVDSVRPFFNQINENNLSLQFQKNVFITSQDTKTSAAATAVVSSAGTISNIVLSTGGFGYDSAPVIKIGNPVGFGSTALAFSSITAGIVTSISITGPGTGYDKNNPPTVLIETPTFSNETNVVNSYEGDFGIITGIKTTSVGVASTGLIFDLHIPRNSFLRNSTVTGVTTISGISTGYYFVVYNSNVGFGMTSLDSSGNVVGVGTTCLDNIYQVSSVSIGQTNALGVGLTYVAQVTVSVSNYNGLVGLGISNFYGEYSWGRITLGPRSKNNTYNAYTKNGFVGIATGSTISRSNPLKYLNYIS